MRHWCIQLQKFAFPFVAEACCCCWNVKADYKRHFFNNGANLRIMNAAQVVAVDSWVVGVAVVVSKCCNPSSNFQRQHCNRLICCCRRCWRCCYRGRSCRVCFYGCFRDGRSGLCFCVCHLRSHAFHRHGNRVRNLQTFSLDPLPFFRVGCHLSNKLRCCRPYSFPLGHTYSC